MTVEPSPTVTEHGGDLGSWVRVWQRPSSALRDLVDGYCGYRQRMTVPATHRGLPGPSLPLVISFGPPQTIGLPGTTRSVEITSFVAGANDRYVLIDAAEHHGIQLDLSPVAAHQLLGQPLGELTGEVVPLETLLGRRTAPRLDELATAPTWLDRFRLLVAALLARRSDAPSLAPELQRAWSRMPRLAGRSGSPRWPPRWDGAHAGCVNGSPPPSVCRPSGWPG